MERRTDESDSEKERGAGSVPAAPASAADNQTQEAGKAFAEIGSGTVVRSPLVGVFYAAPSPGRLRL